MSVGMVLSAIVIGYLLGALLAGLPWLVVLWLDARADRRYREFMHAECPPRKSDPITEAHIACYAIGVVPPYIKGSPWWADEPTNGKPQG